MTNLPSPTDSIVTRSESTLYLLAVVIAARRSRDRLLERVARRRLTALGVDVQFADELPTRKPAKGVRRG